MASRNIRVFRDGCLATIAVALAACAGTGESNRMNKTKATHESAIVTGNKSDTTSSTAVTMKKKAKSKDKKARVAATNRPEGFPHGAEAMAWVEPDKTEPPNTKYKTFHSNTINGDVSYLIYLPPDYEKDTSKRYPVLFWLHGSNAPQSKGGGIVQRVDQAIRDGKAPAMIVVLVNGLRGATMYSDTKDGKWPLESVIVKDLIPHIDTTPVVK